MSDRFDERVREALDFTTCHCLDDYKMRGKLDPQCVWCRYHESVRDALRDAWNDAIEAAAKAIDPTNKRPCDCEICDCSNSGDLAAVTAWDASSHDAKRIRELKETK